MRTKTVILLFGEMGSGKSFLAKRCTPRGALFMEGDDCVPPDMAEAIRSFRPVTELMREQLVKTIKWRVWDELRDVDCVVVAQALYRDEDRRTLLDFWHNECGFDVVPYCVKTASRWQNMRQLLSRPNGWRWVLYWLASKPWFQEPTHACKVVTNRGDGGAR